MPLAMDWHLKVERGYIYMYKGNQRFTCSECAGGKRSVASDELGPVLEARVYEKNKIKFRFSNGEPRARALKDFSWEKSTFSRKFKSARSAEDFVSIWNTEVVPYHDNVTGAYHGRPDNSAEQLQSHEETPPSPKRLKEDTDESEEKIDKIIEDAYIGCYDVSVSCLTAPKSGHTLRDADPIFIESLKKEMIENPTILVSPIVAIVHLEPGEKFDSEAVNSYTYETIGGNNSRIALQELMKKFPNNINYQKRRVAVYSELTNDSALRLAARHNRATDFTHSMKTQDKVATCRRRRDISMPKQEWRRLCSSILSQSVTRLDDSMIYFLASLPDDEYEILLEIFNLFELCDLKDQKLSRKQRGTLVSSKLDCKGVNFKSLRGISPNTRKTLLIQIRDKDISFAELNTQCKYIKKMDDIKANFMKYLNVHSWEVAQEKFPEHAKKEKLEAFLGMTFKKDCMPPLFVSFCKQAKCSSFSLARESMSLISDSDSFVEVGSSSAVLRHQDVLQMKDQDLMAPCNSQGFSLTILHPPEDWSSENILVVCQLVQSVNAACGMQNYNIALVMKPSKIIDSLSDFTTQIVYYTDTTIVNKENPGKLLQSSVFPILLCHWSSSGELSCYPNQSEFVGSLLSITSSVSSTLEGRTAAKPEVYKELINLLSLDGQWVLDPLGGDGSVSVSALQCGRNCVCLESSDEFLGIAYRNILKEKEKK